MLFVKMLETRKKNKKKTLTILIDILTFKLVNDSNIQWDHFKEAMNRN